ncbi:MAG: choice-of-anchor Q domain-containing protein [Dokdonella sp.]
MKIASENLRLALITFCCLAAVSLAERARADITYIVDSTLDQIDDDISDGVCHTVADTCTLRAAVMQANVITGPGVTIELPSGTYLLTRPPAGTNGDSNGDLNITAPPAGNTTTVTISGAGSENTIIDANQLDRAVSVASGRTATLHAISITRGFIAGSGAGGAISNAGNLTVQGCRLIGNITGYGGAINNYGTILITESTLSMNTATLRGGGIHSFGLSASAPAMTKINRCTIDSNIASLGAGIFDDFSFVSIIGTTIADNRADSLGGGVYNIGGANPATLNIYSSTIVNNEAAHNGVASSGSGGGIFNGTSGTSNIRNTLIVGNYRYDTRVADDCKGSLSAYGFNLFSTISACAVANSLNYGLLNSIEAIGPLQYNGGPTLTAALLPGSNAIDAAGAGGCIDSGGNLIVTDQRGYARIFGDSCDIGAYEYGSFDPEDVVYSSGFD